MTTARGMTTGNGDAVELRVPADPAYLAVIRTTTAGLAARLEMTLDEIEDLRIAVDEACALLLEGRQHPGDRLEARFTVATEILEVIVSGPARNLPDRSSFAWTVLEALAGHVDMWATSGRSWIRLSHEGTRRVR